MEKLEKTLTTGEAAEQKEAPLEEITEQKQPLVETEEAIVEPAPEPAVETETEVEETDQFSSENVDFAPDIPDQGNKQGISNEEEGEEFEQLLEESLGRIREIQIGDKVEGEIINITDSYIFVSLGGKRDAYAEKIDYVDKDGNLSCAPGDILSGYVVKYTDTETLIAKSLVSVSKSVLKEAFEEKIPVSGKVVAFTKGGFIVDVSGVRAFCPKSQMDNRKILDVKQFINNVYDFRIIDFRDFGRDIVVSRRIIQDEAMEKLKKETMEKVQLGAVLRGKVTRLTNFGAFLDLGGIEGLLHISEISWARVLSPSEALNLGDEVDVQVIKIDGDKISLSMKTLQENPFSTLIQDLKVGDRINCRILRNLPFGSFVEIKPGVEGLIPISEISLGRRINHPSEIVQEGDLVEAQIMKISPDEQKISLSMKALQPDPWDEIALDVNENDIFTGFIENVMNFGVFVKLKDGIVGLMPASKIKMAGLKIDKGNIGEEIKVRIVNIDSSSRRISLEPSDLPESTIQAKDDWRQYRYDKNKGEDNPFSDL